MKQSTAGQSALMLLLTALLLAYFGIEAYRYFADPFSTAFTYPYEVELSVDLMGYVVRQEQVLDGDVSGFLRTERAEGEKVSAGGTVALVYEDQAALDRQTELDNLSEWLDQLYFARESALSAELSVRLDVQISQSLLAYRESVASDRLAQAEDLGTELRSLVLRRDYIPSSLEELDAEIAQVEARLEELRTQAAPAVRKITAPSAGLYSGAVDGFEAILTPPYLSDLTPSRLTGLKPAEGTGGELGRMVLGDTWYYAAVLAASDAERLEPYLSGRNVSLRFSRSALRDFPVTLASLSGAEGGRAAAVFRSRTYLSEVTLLRRQNAQAVLGTVSGLRVPREALRMVEKEDGSQTTGLYCVVGAIARLKPVEVVYTGDDFYLVQSTIPEKQVSDAEERLRLRPGDEVIVQANDLYDGKVLVGAD